MGVIKNTIQDYAREVVRQEMAKLPAQVPQVVHVHPPAPLREQVQTYLPEAPQAPKLNFDSKGMIAQGIAQAVASLNTNERFSFRYTVGLDGSEGFEATRFTVPQSNPNEMMGRLANEIMQRLSLAAPANPGSVGISGDGMPSTIPALLEQRPDGIDVYIINQQGERVFLRKIPR